MVQAEPGSKIQFGRVLAHKSEGAFNVGRPYLENVTVEAEVLEELKGPKLIVRSIPTPPPFAVSNDGVHFIPCIRTRQVVGLAVPLHSIE